MKRLILLSVILAFTLVDYSQEKDYSLAKVGKRIQGVYVFFDTQPYNEYDFIATIKVTDNWSFKTRDQAFNKIISKAKKKYPYFNGIIFSGYDLHKADIIKFRGLENSGGGLRVGDKIVYKSGKTLNYGELISIDNTNQRATFKYLNIYGEEKVTEKKYSQLNPLSEEQYVKFSAEHQVKIEKYKYKIGEKATWVLNNETFFGEIKSLDNKSHKASVQYLNVFGELKIKAIKYLDIEIITDDEYNKISQAWESDIEKYKFEIGDSVSWKRTKVLQGEIISLNDKSHKASIKYLNDKSEEKIASVSYLKLTLIVD